MEPTQACENCGKLYPESKINSHFSYCRRNIKKCDKCNQFIDINYKEEHEQEFHTKQKCKLCSKEFSQQELAAHENKCPNRPRYCDYCELNIAYNEYDRHVVTCGSRTKACPKCSKNIMLKEYDVHVVTCEPYVPPRVEPKPTYVQPQQPRYVEPRLNYGQPKPNYAPYVPPVPSSYVPSNIQPSAPRRVIQQRREPEAFMYKPTVIDAARGSSRGVKPNPPTTTGITSSNNNNHIRQPERQPVVVNNRLEPRVQPPKVPIRSSVNQPKPSAPISVPTTIPMSVPMSIPMSVPSTRVVVPPNNIREPIPRETRDKPTIFTKPTGSQPAERREPERARPNVQPSVVPSSIPPAREQPPRYNPADYLPPQNGGQVDYLQNEDVELQKALLASMEEDSKLDKQMRDLGIRDMSQSFYRDLSRQQELEQQFTKKTSSNSNNNNNNNGRSNNNDPRRRY